MVAEQFSSFQIGKMLHVSRQAVNQWIDKGYILSFRTPGGHRRVCRVDLVHFLKDHRMPMPQDLTDADLAPATPAPLIMIVDDEEDYLHVLEQAILQVMPQARLCAFGNGLDALVAIGARRPDLLILDMHMPMLDGFEVCRRLKRNEYTHGLPIMVLTAYSAEELGPRLKDLKVDCVCNKFQPMQEITRCVSAFFPPQRFIAPPQAWAEIRTTA